MSAQETLTVREIEFPSGVRVERQGKNTLTISQDGIAFSVCSETALELIRAHVCPRLATHPSQSVAPQAQETFSKARGGK